MEFEEEVGQMTDALEGIFETPKEEVKEEKEEVSEEVVETEEVKEPKVEEEAKEEEEEEKEVVETEEEPAPDDKDAIIADLQAKLAEATSKKEVKEEKEEEPEPEPLQFEEQDFIGEVDIDDLTRDPKEFNKLLNKLYQKVYTDVYKKSVETSLKSMPEIVRKNVEIVNNLKTMHDEFYTSNEDLKPFKKVVAVVFEEVASNNQGKSYDEILKLTAPEVRKRLNLQKVVQINKKKDPPKLPSKGAKAGDPVVKPKTDGIESEIESMINSL